MQGRKKNSKYNQIYNQNYQPNTLVSAMAHYVEKYNNIEMT